MQNHNLRWLSSHAKQWPAGERRVSILIGLNIVPWYIENIENMEVKDIEATIWATMSMETP